MTTAATLQDRIDRAASRVEAERSKLFKSDGSKLYSDEEHESRMSTILEEMNRVVAEVSEAADELTEEKEAELYKCRHACPTGDLLSQQLEPASVKRIFAKEDCEELTLSDLAKRLKGVLEGKKENIWLYARYARRRANRVLEELQRQTLPQSAQQERSAQLRELENTLVRLEEGAKSSLDKEQAEKAEQELQELQGVRGYATRKRMEVDASDARYRREYAQRTWRGF